MTHSVALADAARGVGLLTSQDDSKRHCPPSFHVKVFLLKVQANHTPASIKKEGVSKQVDYYKTTDYTDYTDVGYTDNQQIS